jgi:hypothetical protein
MMSAIAIELLSFDDLTEDQQEYASTNGHGKKCANYIRVTHNGELIFFESDAMEPEDCTFGRDLNWVLDALRTCYDFGKEDGSHK